MTTPGPSGSEYALQHLIDPEVCIRCNTCESTCPIGAITHDDRNYVVDFNICNGCNACVPPCPTGSIDHWHQVAKSKPYSTGDQLRWDSLPEKIALDTSAAPNDELPPEVREQTEVARAGVHVGRPWSAAEAYVNLYTPSKPAIATVTGNFRLTTEDASADIRHIVLDFGTTAFPVLEGQTLGILPPGVDDNGKPHFVRLFSIASPRDGERPTYNNVALTIKRVTSDHDGKPVHGPGSNYMCNLAIGDRVTVVGPYGASFLMPNHAGSSLMMICTGTGAAPMRAMTERRRRRRALNEGGELLLFFGARVREELPYFGPLMKLPKDFIDINFAFSRESGTAKVYVQDRIRERGDKVARMLVDDNCYVYLCGLKGMEAGVLEAFADVCRTHALDWAKVREELVAKNRLHIETY